MKKILSSIMPFFMMAMCLCAFPACSSDDDDDDEKTTATETPTYTDASDAVAGEYVGNVSVAGYEGTIPATVVFNKPSSTMVNMTFDCDDINFHSGVDALNVTVNDGSYIISTKDKTVYGTVAAKVLTLTISGGGDALLFNGVKK